MKIVITGTGRSGTTFLVQLLTELRFNTGYTIDECKQTVEAGMCDGGAEHALNSERYETSDIVKNPDFLSNIKALLPAKHVIICVRDLESVLNSREHQSKNNPHGFGGLINNTREEEKMFNLINFYNTINELVANEQKFTLLSFPKIVFDKMYLYNKLRRILPMKKKAFIEAFNEVVDKEKVRF